MKTRIIAILVLSALSIQCARKADIIQDNIQYAEKQLAFLIEASEEGDTLRIPSTFKAGQIEFVPTDDWVSGFFAGTLWYMYELTGNEYYAEQAQKHTEILHEIQFHCLSPCLTSIVNLPAGAGTLTFYRPCGWLRAGR